MDDIDRIAIALSAMPTEAFYAVDPVVRNSFRHMAMNVKPLVDAAYTAGRESMREECKAAVRAKRDSFGDLAAVQVGHDGFVAWVKALGASDALTSIRALPSEGKTE